MSAADLLSTQVCAAGARLSANGLACYAPGGTGAEPSGENRLPSRALGASSSTASPWLLARLEAEAEAEAAARTACTLRALRSALGACGRPLAGRRVDAARPAAAAASGECGRRRD